MRITTTPTLNLHQFNIIIIKRKENQHGGEAEEEEGKRDADEIVRLSAELHEMCERVDKYDPEDFDILLGTLNALLVKSGQVKTEDDTEVVGHGEDCKSDDDDDERERSILAKLHEMCHDVDNNDDIAFEVLLNRFSELKRGRVPSTDEEEEEEESTKRLKMDEDDDLLYRELKEMEDDDDSGALADGSGTPPEHAPATDATCATSHGHVPAVDNNSYVYDDGVDHYLDLFLPGFAEAQSSSSSSSSAYNSTVVSAPYGCTVGDNMCDNTAAASPLVESFVPLGRSITPDGNTHLQQQEPWPIMTSTLQIAAPVAPSKSTNGCMACPHGTHDQEQRACTG